MIQDLFKTPIYKTTLPLDNTAISKYCLSLSKEDKGRVLSNVGGWQSDNLQGNHPVLNDLLLSIEEHCSIFTKALDVKIKNKIDNIWININGYKDINSIHCHPYSKISGVYYVQTPKDCGNITFYHPSIDTFEYDWIEIQTNYNTYNSAEWWMPSEAGLLYLFPGWLKHSVEANLNKKEKRISISFNIV